MLSDGQEHYASLIGEEDVTERARRAGVPLYFISLLSTSQEQLLAEDGGRRRSTPHDFALKALASDTGARALLPSRLEDLEGVYETVARELSLQYTLAYAPRGARGRRQLPSRARSGAGPPRARRGPARATTRRAPPLDADAADCRGRHTEKAM